MRAPKIGWTIGRIVAAVGALVMFVVYGVRLANDARDLAEATTWVDRHPGWVLLGIGLAALLLLAPDRFWRFVLRRKVGLRVSVATPSTLHRKLDDSDLDYFGREITRLYGITVENRSSETIRNVNTKLMRMQPTQGIPVPVGIGVNYDDHERAGDDRRFDIAPGDKQLVYLVAHPELTGSHCVSLLLHADQCRKTIPINIAYELDLAIVGDDTTRVDIRMKLHQPEGGPVKCELLR